MGHFGKSTRRDLNYCATVETVEVCELHHCSSADIRRIGFAACEAFPLQCWSYSGETASAVVSVPQLPQPLGYIEWVWE